MLNSIEYIEYDVESGISMNVEIVSSDIPKAQNKISENYQPYYSIDLWNSDLIIIMMDSFKKLDFIYVDRSRITSQTTNKLKYSSCHLIHTIEKKSWVSFVQMNKYLIVGISENLDQIIKIYLSDDLYAVDLEFSTDMISINYHDIKPGFKKKEKISSDYVGEVNYHVQSQDELTLIPNSKYNNMIIELNVTTLKYYYLCKSNVLPFQDNYFIIGDTKSVFYTMGGMSNELYKCSIDGKKEMVCEAISNKYWLANDNFICKYMTYYDMFTFTPKLTYLLSVAYYNNNEIDKYSYKSLFRKKRMNFSKVLFLFDHDTQSISKVEFNNEKYINYFLDTKYNTINLSDLKLYNKYFNAFLDYENEIETEYFYISLIKTTKFPKSKNYKNLVKMLYNKIIKLQYIDKYMPDNEICKIYYEDDFYRINFSYKDILNQLMDYIDSEKCIRSNSSKKNYSNNSISTSLDPTQNLCNLANSLSNLDLRSHKTSITTTDYNLKRKRKDRL